MAAAPAVTQEDAAPVGWVAGAEAELGQQVPDSDSAVIELWATIIHAHRAAIATRVAAEDAAAFNALFSA